MKFFPKKRFDLTYLQKIILKKENKLKILSLKISKEKKNSKYKMDCISYFTQVSKIYLNEIINLINLLIEHELSRKKELSYCQKILSIAKYLLYLNEYSLDLACGTTDEIELDYCDFFPDVIIKEVLVKFEKQIVEKHIFVRTNLSELLITADKRRFTQVVYNLVDNAIKYNSIGGTIKINTKCSNGKFFFCISDTGKGIAEDFQNQIFKFSPNCKIQNIYKEHNQMLGLALCKKIVDFHRGEINFASSLNEGSAFGFSIPINQPVLKIEKEQISSRY